MDNARERAAKAVDVAKRRLEEETRKAAHIEAFLSTYPEDVRCPDKIYDTGRPLYGCSLWLDFGEKSWLSYGKEPRKVSLRESVELMRDLPPVGAATWQDGCRYVTPRNDPKAVKAQGSATYTDILGFRLTLEAPDYALQTCVLSWWTQIGDELCKVSCHLASPYPVSFHVEWERYAGGHGEVSGIKRKSVRWADDFSSPGKHFIYAGGTYKDPGRPVCYWPEGTREDVPLWECWEDFIGETLLGEGKA